MYKKDKVGVNIAKNCLIRFYIKFFHQEKCLVMFPKFAPCK